MEQADAWVLEKGEAGKRGSLEKKRFLLPRFTAIDVLVEPLIGSWEANMDHALSRSPVDICSLRNEDQVVLGNGGIVRILKVGSAVTHVKSGDVAIIFGNDKWDDEGFMIKALAYDSPGSMGVLAKRAVMKGMCLLPIPVHSKFSHEQWAAFSLRYITAWSNWRVAYGAWKLQVANPDRKKLYVFGWGGGTPFAELTLARYFGAKSFMMTASDTRVDYLVKAGISPVDRRKFSNLSFDPKRHREESGYRDEYEASENIFLKLVAELTDGNGVSIFIDFIGSPVFRATLKALGREGVITSAGWKLGMNTAYNRAIECMKRTVHVHTHFARFDEGVDAIEFAEKNAWIPDNEFDVYAWDKIPELAEDYFMGKCGYFPLYRVNF